MAPALLTRALLVLALLVPCASAQAPHSFHADKDLTGYEAAGFSEWSDLYVLDEFKAQEGKQLSAAELDGLRARWKIEVERVGKRIAAIQADPRERWIWQLGKRLARHSYFSKIAYAIEQPEPGFVMVVQRPAKEDPGYSARLAAFYMPFVKKMAANFDLLVAQPAGLTRREDQPVTAFAVLASKGDLANYLRFVNDPSGYTSGTAYDYQLQLAVTYEQPFAGTSLVAQRAGLLYEIAKELQHAHLSVPGNRPASIWMYEGLAFLLSAHDGTTPDSLDKHVIQPEIPAWIVELLAKPSECELLLLPIDELAQLRSWEEYAAGVAARVKAQRIDPPDEGDVGGAYYAQCELWAHFLFDGAQAIHRKPFAEFQKSAFHGKGDAEDLRRAFAGVDLRVLSRAFLNWVCDEYERTHPSQKVERKPIETLFHAAAPAAAGSPAGAAPAAAQPLVDPAFSPQMVAPAADDAEAQFALALSDARGGNLERALETLRAVSALAKTPPWPERIARESVRVGELLKLRDGYLGFLKSSGSKLAFKRNGKDVLAPVVALEGGLVKLGENKLGLPSIALVELDPYEVAKQAAKKEQQGGAQPWARFYAYVLAGDARWEKMLKEDAPGASELRADAKDYPALLRTAALARELFELSKLPLPGDAPEARLRLERVKALLAGNVGSELLARRMVELRQLATSCLAQTRSTGDGSELLHAKSEPLPDGRTRYTWEFDAPGEGADWKRQVGYLKTWRDLFPKLALSEESSVFAVEKGHFRGAGQVCYRSSAIFDGPITVRLRYRYVQIEAEHGPPCFYLFVCDDGAGSQISAGDPGFIYVRDLKQSYDREAHASEKGAFYMGEDVEFELVDDGKEVTTSFNQKPMAKAGCGPRKSGNVVLFVHSDLPVSIDRIVIEGLIAPASRGELQAHWVTEQLAALGFP